MSGVENDKGNKKQHRSLNKSKNGSPRKSVSGIKQVRSAKMKLKKNSSKYNDINIQSSEQRSENCTLDETVDDKEDRTSLRKSIRKTVSNKSVTQTVLPEPPPTHYLPIVIQVEAVKFVNFFELITVNRNLVITKVARQLMTLFMPGDQITIVDGIAHWTIDSLKVYSKDTGDRGKFHVAITVIRVWNISCLKKTQLESIKLEERLHYFSVKLYCENETSGLMLCSDKKRILVQHIRAKTPASSVFLVGDQIIGMNGEIFSPLKEKTLSSKKRIIKLVEETAHNHGYVELYVCRLIGARSSPAPSLEAELAEKFAGYAVGVEKGTNTEKRRIEPTSLPLESDALEIALRELTVWKCYEGRNGFEIPICHKGESALNLSNCSGYLNTAPKQQLPAHLPSSRISTPSSSTTSVMGTPPPPKSSYTPTTPKTNTPKKRGGRSKKEQAVKFTEKQSDTAKITSDVPEEDEMKKCDARSGMVAYIKNMFK